VTATSLNLWSPECPARGLPQGGKPTTKSVRRRTVRRSRGRKDKRISESKLCGAVNCNSAALLTRRSLRARGWWDLPIGSSTVTKTPAGLRNRIRLTRVWNHRNWDMSFVARRGHSVAEVPTGPTVQGGQTGVWRTIKDSGPSQGLGQCQGYGGSSRPSQDGAKFHVLRK
jgi:hypothetical protein